MGSTRQPGSNSLLLERATRPSAGRPRRLILDTAAWMLPDDAGEVRSLVNIQRAL